MKKLKKIQNLSSVFVFVFLKNIVLRILLLINKKDEEEFYIEIKIKKKLSFVLSKFECQYATGMEKNSMASVLLLLLFD